MGTTFTLLFVSCTKDESKSQVVANHDAKYDTYYKLLSFIETMEGKPQSHNYIAPRTEYVPADIVEYVEGAMNMEYTDPGLTWADYEETTDTFEIAMTSGHASREDLETLYQEVLDSASAFYYRVSESDKFPYLYDVTNINATSSLLTISFFQQIGLVHRTPTPFGEYDYWSVFNGEGHCAPMTGDTENASDRMNDVLTDYYAPYGCVVWTDLSVITNYDLDNEGSTPHYNWGAENGDDPISGDFIIDYRTFKSFCTILTTECSDFVDNGVYCLDPDEMNYYFQSIVSIYDDYMSDSGLSHRASSIGLVTLNDNGDDLNYWATDTRFGIANACDEEGDFHFFLPYCCN